MLAFLKNTLVSDRVIKDTCLLVFVLWRDNSRVFMRMRITTVSLKSIKQDLLLIALYTIDV